MHVIFCCMCILSLFQTNIHFIQRALLPTWITVILAWISNADRLVATALGYLVGLWSCNMMKTEIKPWWRYIFYDVTYTLTMTLQWRHNKSDGVWNPQPPFIQAQIKDNINAPRHWPLCGGFTGTGEFPAHRASNVENVSIWWRPYGMTVPQN